MNFGVDGLEYDITGELLSLIAVMKADYGEGWRVPDERGQFAPGDGGRSVSPTNSQRDRLDRQQIR